MTRLKPCPFCGGNKIRNIYRNGYHYVLCESCFAVGGPGKNFDEDCNPVETDDVIQDAMIKWNTRPAEERMERALKDAMDGLKTIAQSTGSASSALILHASNVLDKISKTLESDGNKNVG